MPLTFAYALPLIIFFFHLRHAAFLLLAFYAFMFVSRTLPAAIRL